MLIFLVVLLAGPRGVFAATETIGGTAFNGNGSPGYVVASPVTVSAGGSVQSLGIDWAGTQGGNVILGLYSTAGTKPGTILTQTPSTAMSTSVGWQDISVSSAYTVTTGTTYWIAFMFSSTKGYYYNSGSRSYYAKAYGTLDSTWSTSSTQDSVATANLRITYSSGPPPIDFSISVQPPTSQSIGAGATASFPLSLAATGGFSGTVNLSVSSGCPPGVTCSVAPPSVSTYPNTATLSVPTLVSTSGTFNVVVSASNGTVTHTATATVIVGSASTYNFNVRTGATQVVVTVSWSWTGTASVSIAGPGGTPTMSESGAVVYDRTTYVSGSSTPTNIHRVTFTLSSPPTGAWTAYVSQAGATVTIEVS